MGTFFVYILKCALCLAAYYLFYKLLLSRDTFHRFNRFALVTLLLCSLVLPLLQFNLQMGTGATGSVGIELSGLTMAEVVAEDEASLWPKVVAVLFLLYLAGIAFFTLRTLISYLSLWRQIRRCEERPLPPSFASAKARLLVTKDNISPFSWMYYVVASEQDLQENERAILMHELGHIAHHHTLDLMLTEVCMVFQWFNPAIWLMREELQAIHEYEADEAVLCGGVNAREYQLLLIKKAAGSRLQSITNSLHQSSIKKRITMMQKKKSNPWAQAKYLLAAPVTALGVMLFATPTASAISTEISGCKVSNLFSAEQISASENALASGSLPQSDAEQLFTVVEEMPEYTGGTDAMMRFIAENLRYPASCADQGITGRVVLSFVVEKDGSVSSIEEMSSPDERLTAEAIRVVSMMPKWKPGRQRGQEVRVKFVMPVTFHLDDGGIIVIDEVKAVESKKTISFKGGDCLTLLDGQPISAEELNNLSPDIIESMEILKDDASIGKYIDRYPEAKNGVIMISTKK